MRHLLTAVVCIILVLLGPGQAVPDPEGSGRASGGSGEVKALLLVANRYGANYNLLRDVMDVFGWETTVAGVTPTVTACSYGGPMTVDILVSEVTDLWQYDCLVIMPANSTDSHRQLLDSPEALALVEEAVADTLLVVSCCGGSRVLAAADVIDSVEITGAPAFLQEYLDAGAIWAGDAVPPVLDGNILTSRRNQYYSVNLVETMRTAIDSLRAVRRGE
jgi:putative intracellular protease/amidase